MVSNHFELFGLAPRFDLDLTQLEERYRSVLSKAHPDRFVSGTDGERRLAMEWSMRINAAITTLRAPVKRAAYLCELQAIPINAETNTAMAPAFLQLQFAWREALDGLRSQPNQSQLDTLLADTALERAALISRLAQVIDAEHDYPTAAGLVRQLMFVERFAADLAALNTSIGAA